MTDESEVDLGAVCRTLWVGRWRILCVTFFTVAVCAMYTYIATPTFRATAVLAPVSDDRGMGASSGVLGQLGGLASLAGINFDAKEPGTEEALAVLSSCEFIEAFISEHKLLSQIFPARKNLLARLWMELRVGEPTPAKGCKYFTDQVLSVLRDKRTNLVSVMVDWRDRNEAASWANELVARVNLEMRTRAIVRATAYTQYLEKEWAATQFVETREAVSRLMESEIRDRMIATVTDDYAFRSVGTALPPDPDDVYSPNRPLILIGAIIGGLFLGCAIILGYANAPAWLRSRSGAPKIPN